MPYALLGPPAFLPVQSLPVPPICPSVHACPPIPQWSKWGIEDLEAYIQPGSRALLGFNEPNHRLQAALTPREAALSE